MRHLALSLVFITLLAMAPLGAQTVSLSTGVLHEPVAGAHVLQLQATLGQTDGRGVLSWCTDRPRVDRFGDPVTEEPMAYRSAAVQAGRLRAADEKGRERRLFSLAVQGLAGRFFLVVPTREGEAYRLVHESESGEGRRALVLEKAPPPGRPLPGPSLGGVNYSAERRDGGIVLIARGVAPTPGHRIELLPRNRMRFCRDWWLRAVPAEGPAAQVMTPFELERTLNFPPEVTALRLHDRDGIHLVPVERP